jgi:hypothetical protein
VWMEQEEGKRKSEKKIESVVTYITQMCVFVLFLIITSLALSLSFSFSYSFSLSLCLFLFSFLIFLSMLVNNLDEGTDSFFLFSFRAVLLVISYPLYLELRQLFTNIKHDKSMNLDTTM